MNKLRKLSIIFIGLLLIAGCFHRTPDFENTKRVVNQQRFEIVTTFGLFDRYLHSAAPFNNDQLASEKLIFEPLSKEIIDQAEAPFMLSGIKFPYQCDDTLRNENAMLKKEDLAGIIEQDLSPITKSLPGPDTKIMLLPASSFMKDFLTRYHMPGYGVTIGSGKIIIAIDPTFINWKDYLFYAVAHEYHHSTWISRNWVSADFSLLDYLIFEGRANSFATSINPNYEIYATHFLTPEPEKLVWDLIKSRLYEKDSNLINEVMNGTASIPFGSGYTIGYHIVASFKKNNPTYSELDLMDMKPERIFELSGYENKVSVTLN